MLVTQSLARHLRLLGAGAALLAASALAQIPNPTVTAVPAPVTPGDPSRNYIFFASDHDLPGHGYVEEEFFIQGTATRYATPNQANPGANSTGTVIQPSPQPYKTRMVVRRPADPAKFNGVVLVEWYNVTNNFDAENVWFFAWEHMMRAGYVWVGVSAQRVGVNALRAWSPTRYGTLDVTVGNTVNDDSLSYDIYSQAGQVIASPGSVDVLRGLAPRLIIATGESQSAQRLSAYSNSIQPLHNLYDGVMLLSSIGQRIRQDLAVPVFKVLTEWDVTGANEGNVRQDDTRVPIKFQTWEVAGTSHVDQHLRDSREPLELRDNGISSEATNLDPPPPNGCNVKPVGTRVPTTYVLASAFDKLVTWIENPTVTPPNAPRLELMPGTGSPRIPVRNALGLAQGGIQLAQVVAPTRINNGTNSGPGACVRWGYSVPIDQATLNSMYGNSFSNFFNLAARTSKQNVMAGYILPQDLALDLADFSKVKIGP